MASFELGFPQGLERTLEPGPFLASERPQEASMVVQIAASERNPPGARSSFFVGNT